MHFLLTNPFRSLSGPLMARFLPALVIAFHLTACGGSSQSEPVVDDSQQEQVENEDSESDSGNEDSGSEQDSDSEQEPEEEVIERATFSNPLFSNGADPWLQWYQGNYYLTTTTWTSQLVMRKSPTIEGLKTARPHYIWSDTHAKRAYNFWAFEFHRLNGPNGYRWYVMYTAGHSANLDGQKLHVLESAGDDPLGPYEFKSTLMPTRWNIDGSYLTHNGQLYLLWSEWVGADQSTWIASMDNPWTVDMSTAVVITKPELSWEFGEDLSGNLGRVTEGPAILTHQGRTFLSYSTNPCHGPNYKLGVMELIGNNPLNVSDWQKHAEPMFVAANGVYGPGHNGFFSSPDGSEDWLVYHGNSSETEGCGSTRSVRVQPISYDESGFPDFGEPAAEGEVLTAPSGQSGPYKTEVQGVVYHLVQAQSGACLTSLDSQLQLEACQNSAQGWVLDYVSDGYYRLNDPLSGEFLTASQCVDADAESLVNTSPWQAQECALWQVEVTTQGALEFTNVGSGQKLAQSTCTSESGWATLSTSSDQCSAWQLLPAEPFAITSIQSGKVAQTQDCSFEAGASLKQWQWNGSACQRWQARLGQEGHIQLFPEQQTSTCLELTGDTLNPGADIVLGSCAGETAQWRLEPLSDGSLRVVSKASGHVLDLDYCELNDGSNLGQWEWLDNDCQRYTLKSVASTAVASAEPDFLKALTGDRISHDPTLMIDGESWYQYQTGAGIPTKQSQDGGKTWQEGDAIFTDALDWWGTYVPEHEGVDLWAPDIHSYNGKYWLYYSISTFGSPVSAIGLLSSDALDNPWQDEGLVLASDGSQNYNAIDPNLFIDTDDAPWLVWGSWWSGIKLSKLDSSSMKPTGDVYSLATRSAGLEGPSLTYHEGYYYLFVSVGTCCAGVNSTYQIRYGRSASIEGPYLDKHGTNMLDGGGSLLWAGNSIWVGVGGQDITPDYLMSFHGYDARDEGLPKLNLAQLGWKNGWPVLVE